MTNSEAFNELNLLNEQMLTEVKKEDDSYFCGPFWITGKSFLDILKGEFNIEATKYLCNYNGDILNNSSSKSQKTHKKVWDKLKSKYDGVEYTYYPRGRVSVYNGVAFIHINSKCNTPKIIDAIVKEYCLDKLSINIDLNDTYQGNHYNFELK